MSRLSDASERLKSAVDALERVAESHLAHHSQDDPAALAETEALRSELVALRADYDALSRTTETVSRGLDGAVGQLRLVLDDSHKQKQA
ncbi:hypothetical protein [Thalassospira sp.]|uniref:hypothetical protein n=1 Tax=Thalassospira sp. TaxID=1912094 RepID=UPI002734EEDA|nr:hypothetical protein [Thalassospira sp.]MDP2697139.1 hypothetical protein [Thalassospira sp.]